jgi:hypothetical protein
MVFQNAEKIIARRKRTYAYLHDDYDPSVEYNPNISIFLNYDIDIIDSNKKYLLYFINKYLQRNNDREFWVGTYIQENSKLSDHEFNIRYNLLENGYRCYYFQNAINRQEYLQLLLVANKYPFIAYGINNITDKSIHKKKNITASELLNISNNVEVVVIGAFDEEVYLYNFINKALK